MPNKPLIHSLLAAPMSGEEIERRSFAMIDALVDQEAKGPAPCAEEWAITRRLIHTTGDIGLRGEVRFSTGFIEAAIAALRRGAPIVVDARMIQAGLSADRLARVCQRPFEVRCHIADPDVAEEARRAGLPRSLFALRKARPVLDGAIVVFGNAPVALLELNRMIAEEGIRPAFVVGFPVGFVHVVEAKEELERMPVPHMTLRGRRGGSPLAVAAIHALASLAAVAEPVVPQVDNIAVVLMGHGSRCPGAARGMEEVAAQLRGTFKVVEGCYMSQVPPYLDDAIARCAAAKATKVIVVPYFLHEGIHIREDIPEILADKAQKWPGIELRLAKPLGYSPALVDLVTRRIHESLEHGSGREAQQ